MDEELNKVGQQGLKSRRTEWVCNGIDVFSIWSVRDGKEGRTHGSSLEIVPRQTTEACG